MYKDCKCHLTNGKTIILVEISNHHCKIYLTLFKNVHTMEMLNMNVLKKDAFFLHISFY